MAFAGPSPQDSYIPCKAVWINVESIIKPAEADTEASPRSVTGSHLSHKRRHPLEGKQQKMHKRVKFQPLPGPAQPLHTENVTTLPNLCLQQNFCTAVQSYLQQQLPVCNHYIGLLGDNGACKHLVYIDHPTNGMATSTSLSQLISLSRTDYTKCLGLYERIRLAKCLATAVLYYHATPWLNELWRSDNIHFFGDGNFFFQQSPHALPYMSASVRASGCSTGSKVSPSDYDQIIRNPVLFGLGIMFLELAFQAPLGALQHSIDFKRGETQGFAEYFTAQRLVEHCSAMISQSYQSIVKKCLYCDFGHDSNFRSPALQEAFYREVIGGLGRRYFKISS